MSLLTRVRETIWSALTPANVKALLETVLTQLSEPGWLSLSASGTINVSDNPYQRKDALEASRYYQQWDALYGRAIRLTRNYTFGRGVSWKAVDDGVNDVLEAFWQDADNSLLGRAQGQWELADRLQTLGELFLVFFVNKYNGHVKVTTVEPEEVTRIITDPHNKRHVQYYQREWVPQYFDWESQSYKTATSKTDFYPDWSAKETQPEAITQAGILAECTWCGQNVWVRSRFALCPHCGASLKEAQVIQDDTGAEHSTVRTPGTAVYMHYWRVNSFGVRGMPAYFSAIPWAKVYKGFMEDRATITLAAATFAFKQKVKGGAQQVARMITQWGNYIAGRYGGAGTGRERAEGSQILVENEASDLQQLNFDTRASNAYQDGRMIRQQVSAATDITEPDLTGDPSVGNLASMTAMAGPQLKGFESWQQRFEDFYRDVFDFVIRMAILYGQLPLMTTNKETGATVLRNLEVEVDFPPILTHDLPTLISAIASLVNTQIAGGREYVTPERIARYITQAFGETDIDAALAELDFDAPPPEVSELPDETAEIVGEVLRILKTNGRDTSSA